MEPFYFDSRGSELLGIYHPAADPNSRRGVVICPPLLTDLSRSYQSIRLLAEHCASAGYHVLRFDYSGTGDSFGEWENAGPARWIGDIVKAAEELSEISGTEFITLLGIRFGGLLALHAAERVNPESLMLWDPIADGVSYRSSLNTIHENLIGLHANLTESERQLAERESCGFGLAPWVTTELETLQAPETIPDSIEKVDLVNTIGCSGFSDIDVRWTSDGRKISCRQIEFDCSWDQTPEVILNPSPVITELATCL